MSDTAPMPKLDKARMDKSLTYPPSKARGIYAQQLQPDIEVPDGHEAVFLIQSGKRRVAVSLDVVAQCVKAASDGGHIPPVPQDWWEEVIKS